MRKLLLSLIFFGIQVPVFSQELLTLDKAIGLVMQNNFGIIIAGNQAQMAKNDDTWGNAGFLPQVNVTGGGNLSANDTRQHYSSGQEVDKNNVSSSSLNAGIGLSWTLFDGLKMFASASRLQALAEQGELNLKIEIENTLYQLMQAYYEVVRQKQLIRASEEILSGYEEQEKISETRLAVGSGNRQELLQTKVDKNSIRSSLLLNRQALSLAKASLNLLMARPPETEFDITDSLNLISAYSKESLFKSVPERNFSLAAAGKELVASRYSIREFESQRLPKAGITAAYNFGRTENKAGFVLLNQNLGYNLGFTVSWNLFNGFNTFRQVKNARLVWRNAQQMYDYTKSAVSAGLYNSWKEFEDAREILKLEEDNILLALENREIALHRYKLGASNILELKSAQSSYESASARLVSARYNARMAEIKLMKLNGDLLR